MSSTKQVLNLVLNWVVHIHILFSPYLGSSSSACCNLIMMRTYKITLLKSINQLSLESPCLPPNFHVNNFLLWKPSFKVTFY